MWILTFWLKFQFQECRFQDLVGDFGFRGVDLTISVKIFRFNGANFRIGVEVSVSGLSTLGLGLKFRFQSRPSADLG